MSENLFLEKRVGPSIKKVKPDLYICPECGYLGGTRLSFRKAKCSNCGYHPLSKATSKEIHELKEDTE